MDSSVNSGCAAWILRGVLMPLMVVCSLDAQSFPYFDGRRAFQYLQDQVEFGPRYSGSEGHEKLVEYLAAFLEPRSDVLLVQHVTVPHPYPEEKGDSLPIINLLARYNPEVHSRILLLAHYDTRPMADQDPDPANRNKPIPGANDGASGVAVLLALAEILADQPPEIGVDILLVDAEDLGRSGDLEKFSLGVKALVKEMGRYFPIRPRYAVLLDMVGDAELDLPIEYNSFRYAEEVVHRIWGLAQKLGYPQFKYTMGTAIYDDHIALNEAGIPTVDVIDINYPNRKQNYWHTLEDTPDKCSPESLEAVGTVITALVYGEEP